MTKPTDRGRRQLSLGEAYQAVEDAASGATDRPDPLTVGEVCRRVNRALETIESGRELEVVGEVGDCHLKQHWYFTLLDAKGAKLPCSFFSTRRRLDVEGVRPDRGMKVVVRGRLEYWAEGGRMSLIVTRIREAGTGDLHERFERLRRELEAKGVFDERHHLPLPTMARRLLVLTSASGAVRSDIEETARRRWPGIELLLAPIPVQGDSATPVIADAIRRARGQAPALGVDAIVLARGGGSLEDLWCFNEAEVVTAIHESRTRARDLATGGGPRPVPLVSAIGHESDVTLCDFVADHRASTPTQAAMVLVIDATEHREMIRSRADRLGRLLERTLERSRARLDLALRHELIRRPERLYDHHVRRIDGLGNRLGLVRSTVLDGAASRLESASIRLRGASPAQQVERGAERLERAGERLVRGMARRHRDAETRISHLSARLESVGPRAVLDRGYALVRDEAGRPVRDATTAKAGDRLQVELSRGDLGVTVDRPWTESGDSTSAPTGSA